MITLCTLSLLLSLIAVQDFRARMVSIILFIFVFLMIPLYSLHFINLSQLLLFILQNIGFLLTQLFFLWLYLIWKNGFNRPIINEYIGWGDILFFLLLCGFFAPVQFLFFYVFSLIFILLFSFILRFNSPSFTIPLAGGQSLLLLFYLWFNHLMDYSPFDDSGFFFQLYQGL